MELELFIKIAIGVFLAIIMAIPVSCIFTKGLFKTTEFIDYIERKRYGNKYGVELELEKTRRKLNRKRSRF